MTSLGLSGVAQPPSDLYKPFLSLLPSTQKGKEPGRERSGFYSLWLSLWLPGSPSLLPVTSFLPRARVVPWVSVWVSASSQSPQ